MLLAYDYFSIDTYLRYEGYNISIIAYCNPSIEKRIFDYEMELTNALDSFNDVFVIFVAGNTILSTSK
jgi:hypothetical protein